jgi:SAM-dependent methyltransferase
VRSLVGKLLPRRLLGRLRQLRERRLNRYRSAEEVFTRIYATNAWGGARGEFCSGSGSADAQMLAAYVDAIAASAASEGFRGLRFVDLGCGDFRAGKHLLPLCSRYVGVDVVAPLVERNEREFGDATTRFVHLDIVADPLPDGDVCFVRHVLQHLSNAQILAILPKLARYRWVFVTEHHPADGRAVEPNRDMVHGGYVRVWDGSGVYLAEPPFALPAHRLTQVMEIPGSFLPDGVDPGIIRTFLYKPRDA